MTDEELHNKLVELLGLNYHNYPQCVEWNLRVIKYIYQRQRETHEN